MSSKIQQSCGSRYIVTSTETGYKFGRVCLFLGQLIGKYLVPGLIRSVAFYALEPHVRTQEFEFILVAVNSDSDSDCSNTGHSSDAENEQKSDGAHVTNHDAEPHNDASQDEQLLNDDMNLFIYPLTNTPPYERHLYKLRSYDKTKLDACSLLGDPIDYYVFDVSYLDRIHHYRHLSSDIVFISGERRGRLYFRRVSGTPDEIQRLQKVLEMIKWENDVLVSRTFEPMELYLQQLSFCENNSRSGLVSVSRVEYHFDGDKRKMVVVCLEYDTESG
jgi:hypothetical protein